jgi:hypothetical protein
MAARIVTEWAPAATGRALWLVGSHAAKVQAISTVPELRLIETNQMLAGLHPSSAPVVSPEVLAGVA